MIKFFVALLSKSVFSAISKNTSLEHYCYTSVLNRFGSCLLGISETFMLKCKKELCYKEVPQIQKWKNIDTVISGPLSMLFMP
jgi:hypothetical protein